MNTQMISLALQQALRDRHQQPSLLHHSDCGVQYTNHDYIGLIEAFEE